jgi:hypothetical protein
MPTYESERMFDSEWRTVKLFLTKDYVCEVLIHSLNPKHVKCTCDRYYKWFPCKHVKHVKQRMAKNDGYYSIEVPEEVLDDEILDSFSTAKGFREFVIAHTPIGYL